MKKIILLILTTLIMVACDESKPEKISNNYKVIKIDSCEFVECKQTGYSLKLIKNQILVEMVIIHGKSVITNMFALNVVKEKGI